MFYSQTLTAEKRNVDLFVKGFFEKKVLEEVLEKSVRKKCSKKVFKKSLKSVRKKC
jgi:hypothetical protein